MRDTRFVSRLDKATGSIRDTLSKFSYFESQCYDFEIICPLLGKYID
jgi:hypothetical protein